jgi:hypothetical protein
VYSSEFFAKLTPGVPALALQKKETTTEFVFSLLDNPICLGREGTIHENLRLKTFRPSLTRIARV